MKNALRLYMNDRDFKRHLKDLVARHHHPEEHDWGGAASASKKREPAPRRESRQAPRKSVKKK